MTPRKKSNQANNSFVLIVDIGVPTSRILESNRTFVEQAKECVLAFIEQKIFTGSVDDVAIILVGSEGSENILDYKHVTVLINLEKVNWETAKLAENNFRVTSFEGDWMDALGVALDLIHKKKEEGIAYEKNQILLFTPLVSPCKTSEKSERIYTSAILKEQAELFFIGSNVEFDGDGNLLNDEKLSKGELTAYKLINETEGSFLTFDEFSASVLNFVNQPKMGTGWQCTLDIGSQIKIPVSGYIKSKKGDCLTWREETANEEAMVERERTYEKDPTTLIDKEYVMPAYKYGSKNVPLTLEEEETYGYKSGPKCFTLLAFVDPIPPQFYLGTSTIYFFAERKKGVVNKSAQIALSSLIYAMEEMGKVALVRRVYRQNSRVSIGVLAPRIKFKYECFVYHELPFADDWRQYEFPPVITPNNQPNQEQLDAIDLLIDKFDLMIPEKNGEFSFDSRQVTDPHEEYIRTAIAAKILHPELPLPNIPEHIRMYIEPSPVMLKNANEAFNRIKELFPLEVVDRIKVYSAEASKRGAGASTAPEEDVKNVAKKPRLDETGEVDLMSIFGAEVVKIGTATPVQDFLELLKSGKKTEEEVYAEMEKVIVDLLCDSGGSNAALLSKAKECIQIYRQRAIDAGKARAFNDWMSRFREHIIGHYFHEFWQRYIIDSKLGLITKQESSASDISEDQAEQFFAIIQPTDTANQPEEDDEALLDLI